MSRPGADTLLALEQAFDAYGATRFGGCRLRSANSMPSMWELEAGRREGEPVRVRSTDLESACIELTVRLRRAS